MRLPPAAVLLTTIALAATLVTETRCTTDDDGQDLCYDEKPYTYTIAGMTSEPTYPCHWTYEEQPAIPEGYEFRHVIGAWIPKSDEPCDPCDAERWDALLQEALDRKLAEGSCASIDASPIVRGCLNHPDEFIDQCAVIGVYFSNYEDTPVEDGCD